MAIVGFNILQIFSQFGNHLVHFLSALTKCVIAFFFSELIES
jgi:hypothetical protein